MAGAVLLAMNVSLLLGMKCRGAAWMLTIPVIVCLIAAWLGSYQFSPLAYGTSGPPVVSGFRIIRLGIEIYVPATGETLPVPSAEPVGLEPLMLPSLDTTCQWYSENGGAIDDPSSCDMAYEAPRGSSYDVLRLLVRPACALPETSIAVRISIEP